MKLYILFFFYKIYSILGCYNGSRYNLTSWCLYHNGTHTNTCKFNERTTALNAANDPLHICIYNWGKCNENSDCNNGTGHRYCVKNGCCSPGYCMVSEGGVFSIPNYDNNVTYDYCQEIGGAWNITNNECMWYEIQCG